MRKLPLVLICIISALCTRSFAQLKIDNIVDDTFKEETVQNIKWMNDGRFYTVLEENRIVKYEITTGAIDTILFDGGQFEITLDEYSFSAKEDKLLLMTNRASIYRRSYTADYYVFDFENKEMDPLSENGSQSYATFSPDGSMVAFTRGNNLFYTRLVNMSETQVTDDGAKNSIINGSSDWVYEEEFSITKAFYWSPDSKKIAYLRFDESRVKEYNLQRWNNVSLYPEDYRFKYPKAGEANAIVQAKVYDIAKNEHLSINLGKETDVYLPRMQWTASSNLLSIKRLNRLQNQLDIIHVNAISGSSEVVLTERSKTYIDLTYCDELVYLKNGIHFLISSERSGFKHFYLHTMDGQTVEQVTSGLWEAHEMVGLDQSSRTPILYYISSETSPLNRALYRVDVKGRGKELLSPESGWVNIDMSTDFKYFMQTYRQAEQPAEISLREMEKYETVKILKDNQTLKDKVAEFNLVDKVFFTMDGADKSILNAYMLRPVEFDSAKQYPVLLFQYSGPGSQRVMNRWTGGHFIWHQYLVQQGYLVVVIDTRGTGARGVDFKNMTYKELGKLEVEDHIATAQFLRKQSFVDSDRIGIWGWSYGGYMSSLAILKGADYFKAAIAVAPVTTWRFYDTIYTERYLQRPQDNPSGYDENSPLNHVEKLKGKFLLIHGTGDDNVHFQNSVAMQDALINAGKQFESFYYPDKAHGISGKTTRIHLYTMMTDFLKRNL